VLVALRYALLGLLSQQAASGYDLAKAFEGPLGQYAWQAGHNRIYPELARLTEEGLIEVAEEGARGRRTYAVTEAGLAELRSWVLNPLGGSGTIRNEPVLRLFLLSALEPDDARRYLRQVAETTARDGAQLREAMANESPDPTDGPLPFGWLAAGFGIRQYDAAHDWANWALAELDKFEQDSPPNPKSKSA
jgi:DNA-binding PadR family transcriptional regulator